MFQQAIEKFRTGCTLMMRTASVINSTIRDPYVCPHCRNGKGWLINGWLRETQGQWHGKATMQCRTRGCGKSYTWKMK
jgi:hypothetical protein